MRTLYLRDDLAAALRTGEFGTPRSDAEVFAALSTVEGQVYRRTARRRTSRVVIAGRPYFAKVHDGVGWGEIAKNLLTAKRPVLGARHEYRANRRLRDHGVAVPGLAAFGECGFNPARRRSFAISDALDGYRSLEDVGHGWLAAPPDVTVKRNVLTALGQLTRAMHAGGVCHRDYYACHILANAASLGEGQVELAVIDLHRAVVHGRLSRRARVRDLGALLYSSSAMPLTRGDRLRFVAAYAGTSASVDLRRRPRFWRAVSRRAELLQARATGRGVAAGREALIGTDVASVGRLGDLGRDPPLPFRFDVDFGAGGERALCTAVLRAQPHRRLVLRVVLDGREQIVKALFGARVDRDFKREQRGVRAMREAGIATPRLLGAGRGGGARLLAFEALADAREPSADDVDDWLRMLARMHHCGIRQRDLHPGNFVVSGARLYAVDGSGIAVSKAVGRARRMADLARLLAHYPSTALGTLAELARTYENAAGITLPPGAMIHLDARVARARRHRLARYMAKTGRECTAFAVHETPQRRVVVARGDDDQELKRVIADPEGAITAGESLKHGNTAVAVRCGALVVKRYNVKNRWHSYRSRLRPTRAFRAWRAGHGLRLAGIATPRPRALVEMHRPRVGDAIAYLVVDHVAGSPLAVEGVDDRELNNMVAGMFRAWRELRFVHGDTKATNFVVTGSQVHVLDLDAATFHRGDRRFRRQHRRDRMRFLANFPDAPAAFREAVRLDEGDRSGTGERT